jgi:hypothetical protein
MLTESNWVEFREKFPSAAAWMDRRELENELKLLRSRRDAKIISTWQEARLAELEQWELSQFSYAL